MKKIATLILCLWLTSNSWGQTQKLETATTPDQFKVLERQIEAATQHEYDAAREVLAKQALAVAEKDIQTSHAEGLLHWILRGSAESQTAHQATRHLLEHHVTSPTSVRQLISYAQRPSRYTPKLFAGFADADLPDELDWIVSASTAIHQKSLLLIADEMAIHDGDTSRFRASLGEELADQLAHEDLGTYQSRVITTFRQLAEQHGKQSMGGMTIAELSEGSIFTVRHLRLGKTATGLSGKSVDGKKIELEEYRGKVVLIDFWATWCAPCVMAMPELRNLHDELAESNFTLIGVSEDTNKKQLSQFIKKHDVRWPNLFDRDGSLQKKWQSLSLPWYYVLDEKGTVRYRGNDHRAAAATAKSCFDATANGAGGGVPVAEIARSILDSLDANQDHKIEQSEMPDQMKAKLGLVDLDQDGSLSLQEITHYLKQAEITTETVSPTAAPEPNDSTKLDDPD